MTNTQKVATENAVEVTKTICRSNRTSTRPCGTEIRSCGCAMVACPSCGLIQYAGNDAQRQQPADPYYGCHPAHWYV